jgi:hypothetical protein
MVEREQRGALNAMLKSMKLGEEALIKLTCGCVGWRRCASSVRRIASQAVSSAKEAKRASGVNNHSRTLPT